MYFSSMCSWNDSDEFLPVVQVVMLLVSKGASPSSLNRHVALFIHVLAIVNLLTLSIVSAMIELLSMKLLVGDTSQ